MIQPVLRDRICAKCDGNKYIIRNDQGFLKASICRCFGCEQCNSTGRVFGEDENGISVVRECKCAGFIKSTQLLNNAGIPGKFLNASFENYETKGFHRSMGTAKKYAQDVVEDFGKAAKGLVFMGGPGLGKTHLAVAIVKVLILKKVVDCKFVDFFQLLSDIRHGYSQSLSDREIIDPYVKSTVLVIDELAKGRNTEWELTILDQIISSRYNAANKITLFTTNFLIQFPMNQIEKQKWQENEIQKVDPGSQKYVDILKHETLQDRIGPRIFSRLTEICKFAILKGTDIRKQHCGQVPSS